MGNLLKAEFFRLRKDITSLLGIIISTGIVLMGFGIMAIVYSISNQGSGIEGLINTKMIYMNSFQAGNNVGLVLSVIVGLLIVKDFTQNTIRHKVLFGYSRTKIYLSLWIVTTLYATVVMLGFALINIFIHVAAFGYQGSFGLKDFYDMALSTGIALLNFNVFMAIITLIATKMKSVGATIGLTIAVLIIESIVGTGLMMASTMGGWPQTVKYFLHIFPTITTTWLATYKLDVATIIITLSISIIYIVGFTFLGVNLLKRSDIK